MIILTMQKTYPNLCSKSAAQVVEILIPSMRRFQTRKNNGVGDYTMCRSLFLCPKSTLSALKDLSLWWGRLLEQLRYAASETNMNSHRPKCQTFCGGLSLNNGASQMPKSHTTNPRKPNAPSLNTRLKSLFNLCDANRNTIASSLTFEQIKPIADRINGSLIKFDRMAGEIS